MSGSHPNNYPKLHNAAWPGVVGKGGEGAEPCIELATMLDLTAAALVDGIKFDGFDLFLFLPHINIDASDDEIKTLAEMATSRGLVIGSVVAPVWGPTGGGSAMDEGEGRKKFLRQVKKGCTIARRLRELGARPHGVVRFDSACSPMIGSPIPRGTRQRSPRRSARRAQSRAITGRSWPPRERFAGAACTPGGR